LSNCLGVEGGRKSIYTCFGVRVLVCPLSLGGLKDLTTVYDVPPHDLIAAVAQELKAAGKVQPPTWAEFAKTGVNREMPPTNPDWWFVRCASVLRRIYIDGPVGVSRLRSFYGGKHRKGVATGFFAKGSGSVVRESLQQLEKAGYVRKLKKGRQMTPEGQAYLDGVAHKVISKTQSEAAPAAEPAAEPTA
jgi:small subunit ribosomal protein S19e